MAEAIVNARMGKEWLAKSAGSKPQGYVHPKAIQVLKEMGINHQGSSKSIDSLSKETFDVVVTVCEKDAQNCPVWIGVGQQFHLPYPDPFNAVGSEEEILLVYRQVVSDIETQIPALLAEIN
jgi:arsenate reductase